VALCIKRIQTDVSPPAVTIFPGRFENRVRAEWVLKGILMGYWQSGKDRMARGTWWAREKNGRCFTFVIIPEIEAADDGSEFPSNR
jgi:hypothetical protein